MNDCELTAELFWPLVEALKEEIRDVEAQIVDAEAEKAKGATMSNLTKWAVKFLDQLCDGKKVKLLPVEQAVKRNAAEAEKNLAVPAQLWNELTAEFRRREFYLVSGANHESVFMAGFSVGWHECLERLKTAKVEVKAVGQ